MNAIMRLLVATLALALPAETLCAAGNESVGNVDGVLTWNLGDLPPGDTARQVVLFAYADSHEQISKTIETARKQFDTIPAAMNVAPETALQKRPLVIRNSATDFAFGSLGSYTHDGGHGQRLACDKGGQLSQFQYYLHYNDGQTRRAGTWSPTEQERLHAVKPFLAVSPTEALGTVETGDGKLQVQIRGLLGDGPVVAVEFVVANASQEEIKDVKLSAYANIEASHTPGDDYAMLDSDLAGLRILDLASGMHVAMVGLTPPSSGYAGVWASRTQLQTAAGTSLNQWQSYTAILPSLKKRLLGLGIVRVPHSPALPHEPHEPETRDFTADEANTLLEGDWLFQADGHPTLDRTLQEIAWTEALAARLCRHPATPDLSSDLNELGTLKQKVDEAKATGDKAAADTVSSETAAKELYLAVRRVKRRIMFKNPVLDFSQVLFIDNPYPEGGEWAHQARHRNGMMAVPGGRLLVLDGLHPGGHLRKLAPEQPGGFWRPDLSFDAQRVLFCYKSHDETSFHLYEVNVDGNGLRQLTDSEYDDLDPIYLPDGRIIFSTSRCNTYVRCMPYTYSYVIARCEADGSNVYLLSRNNEPDWCPSLLNDGRVIYSRWEYHDKALWRIQSLWVMNPDGTNVVTFWGNQSVWPDHLAEPRAIPGSRRVMFTGLAHHGWFAGSIGIIDPAEGFNFPHGLTKVTADVAWPECGRPPLDPVESPDYHRSGAFTAYKTPYPLSEEDFLVSACKLGKFDLYLMDVDGNRELIYPAAFNIWHAMPVRPRPVPPQQPDRVIWPGTGANRQPPAPGVLYSADVYQDVPDLPRGTVKYLRVVQMDSRTYSTWRRDGRFSGPVVSVVQDDGVKRILGTVPVESDGSVAFEVPSGKALHFQLLDERYRAVHTMRSFSGVMPGERRGCVGCHELHSAVPVPTNVLALRKSPAKLTPPPWGTDSISYLRHVQPVLDRYCGKCHQGDGEARKDYDLTLRPGRGVFQEPYLTLIGYTNFNHINIPSDAQGIAGALLAENFPQSDPASYVTLRPMRYLSYTSKLIDIASSGKHYDVKVDPASLRQLIGWVDANCPYRGDPEVREIEDPDFPGVDQLPIRPRTKTAPDISRP